MLPLILITAFAAFIFGLASLHHRQEEQRRSERRHLAADYQMQHYEKDDLGLIQQLKHFELFRREQGWFNNGKISNLMTRTVGDTEVFLFDYEYKVSTGKSTVTIRQTVFFANNKEWYLPRFQMKPENWWHKMLQTLGLQSDINFSDHPEFSEKYWLTGELEQQIRKQFSPELQYFLLDRPPVHLEGDNFYLLAYKPGKRLNSDEARSFFEHCCQLVQLLRKEDKTALLQLVALERMER
jgi:hypothetical protein